MNGLSIEDYNELMKFQKKNKFKNIKTIVDDIKFDSLKEARYYGKLKLLKQSGEVIDFKIQPRYDLIVNGTKIGFYKADFKVTWKSGNVQVVDVKSNATKNLPVYRLKKKLIFALYQIKISEI